MIRYLLSIYFLLASAISVWAGDWPQFRGPGGTGIADETELPETWGPKENIKWKAPLPGPGNGSPIVSNGRVFVTYATDKGRQRSLACFDRTNGKNVWTRTVEFGEVEQTHQTNPYAGSTPVANGERVVVWHGSAGLFCYDFDGNELWSRDLGTAAHMWGFGSSPILHDGQVLLNFGPGEESFMVAVDLETGAENWRTEEPGGRNGQEGGLVGSWCTPSVVTVDGDAQVICSMPSRVVAYDPNNGEILWTVDGLPSKRGALVYPSTVFSDGIGIAMGGYKGPSMGFRLGGRGNVTKEQRLWRIEEKQPQRIGTGVVLDGHIFIANAGPGTVQCIDAESGEVVWETRFPGGGDHWGSTVYGDGKLYVTNQDGVTHVFRPSTEKLELIASNQLEGTSNSTPALSDGEIFIRTSEGLWCISNSEK